MNMPVRELEALFEVGALGGLSDEQLLDRFVERREEAVFEAIVRRHGPMVWGVCRRVLRDHHDAEDAFQASFLVLARKAASLMVRRKLGHWLSGVAYRTATKARAMRTRRRTRENPVSDIPEPESRSHDLRGDLTEWLDRELSRLPERYRMPIVLCELQGMAHKEAASQLGWPVGTVSSRLSRGRSLLARRLARQGLSLSVGALATLLARESAGASLPTPLIGSTARAAASWSAAGGAATAGVVSAEVATLTKEVWKSMSSTRFEIGAAILVVGSALVAGGTGLAYRAQPAEPGQESSATAGARSAQNLIDIVLAMINFSQVSAENRFPPAAIRKDGKPLLSWRVAILPFLGQQELYERFHLDEPWDSPHNKALLRLMPEVYAPVVRIDEPRGATYYQVFTGPGSPFEDERGPRFLDMMTSHTLTVVEAGSPVPWTKPEDIAFDREKPLPRLGRPFNGRFHGAFADDSVLLFNEGNDPDVLRCLITGRGAERVRRYVPGNEFEMVFRRKGQEVRFRGVLGSPARGSRPSVGLGTGGPTPRVTP